MNVELNDQNTFYVAIKIKKECDEYLPKYWPLYLYSVKESLLNNQFIESVDLGSSYLKDPSIKSGPVAIDF